MCNVTLTDEFKHTGTRGIVICVEYIKSDNDVSSGIVQLDATHTIDIYQQFVLLGLIDGEKNIRSALSSFRKIRNSIHKPQR